jgi:hypothetical protein
MNEIPYHEAIDSYGCLLYAEDDPCAISDVEADLFEYVADYVEIE